LPENENSTNLVLYKKGRCLVLRIARLTDYAIVLLTRLATAEGGGVLAAAELAGASQLPYATVSKILKALSRAGLVISLRGVQGGYRLARPANRVSVAEIIAAIEGPIALTECSADAPGLCDLEAACPVRRNWQRINATVREALDHLTLEEMARPLSRAAVSNLTLIRSNRK
jgi:FeS assembly SUF system regulator